MNLVLIGFPSIKVALNSGNFEKILKASIVKISCGDLIFSIITLPYSSIMNKTFTEIASPCLYPNFL